MRKYVIAALLGTGAVGAIGAGVLTTAPASAQMSVFDTSNYTQNLLTAARTLQQINNQIQSLQNEAQMLAGQAKNLSRIDFPQLDQLRQNSARSTGLWGRHRVSTFASINWASNFVSSSPTAIIR